MAESTPSAVPGGPAGPAVAFAEWLPALGGSRLLRVHGHDSREGPPALVLRTPGGDVHIEPRGAGEGRFTREHEWRASFLIPADVVSTGWDATSLEWPGGDRLPLPDPPTEPRAEVIDPTVLTSLRARRTSTTSASPESEPPSLPAAVSSPAAASLSPPPAVSPSPPAATPSPEGAMSPSPHAPGGGSWTAPPEAFTGSVFEAEAVWTAKRAELERELSRAAASIARAREGERAAREAVLAALGNVRADLRAVRAARAADESALVTLNAELDAERVAHTVTRAIAKDLRAALAEARNELRARGDLEEAAQARGQAAGLRAALEAERSARAHAEAALRGAFDPAALDRRAREQAETAAAAARRPPPETGELLANLDAAAAALRAAAPAADEDSPRAPEVSPGATEVSPGAPEGSPVAAGISPGAAEVSPGAPEESPVAAEASPQALEDSPGASLVVAGSGPARPLRVVLVDLAREDPVAAGKILVALLPAQGAVLAEAVAYDLTVRGVGTFAVSVADGEARVQRLSQPRSRGEAAFHLVSDPLTLAELLAGEPRRIGRFTGPARVKRRRRQTRVLRALPAAGLSLAAAVRAGARLEPGLVYRALPLAIDPAWTKGHAFTVAQEITGPDARTWYLTIRDGAGLEVADKAPAEAPDATVTMTRAAFDRLLRDEPPVAGERPLVRGDRAAVAILKAWTDRARGGGA